MPENPYASDTRCLCPDDWREPFDKTRCPQHGGAAYESVRAKAYREGAAAGVAASEAQVRELEDALRYLANRHHSSLSPSSLHDPEHQDWTECKAFSCARVAALLSEEPGAG